jgi:hypothetical protein
MVRVLSLEGVRLAPMYPSLIALLSEDLYFTLTIGKAYTLFWLVVKEKNHNKV